MDPRSTHAAPNTPSWLRRKLPSMLCASLAVFAWGCGESAAEGEPKEAEDAQWQTLLSGEWTMPAGAEDYVCVRKTITEDIYVRGLEAVNPPGTHHTFLTIGDATKPDGVAPCTVAENYSQSIFGSGVGTNPIEFPEGVGMKLPAGKQLLLNLHLYNGAETELSGTSGTRAVRVDESEIEFLGDNIPALTMDLNIPPHQDTTTSAVATMKADTTIFAVLPHMHVLGIHAKVVAESSIDGERLLHDAPYDFDAQLYYPVESIRMAAGDKVRFECTWRNTTARTIQFGDSSDDEMCAIGLYRYPGL